jgi:nitrate reductase alpha subunit
MNEIAKKCIQTKLIVAIEKEGLKTSEAAKILDISPTYVSLIKNSDHWHKCTKAAWEAVQKWTNSGLSLREYSIERQFPNYDKAIEDHNKRTQWIISGLQGNKQKDYMKGDKWDDTKTPSQDDLINAVKEAIITEDQKVNIVEYVDGLLKGDEESIDNIARAMTDNLTKNPNNWRHVDYTLSKDEEAPVNEPIKVSIEIDITLSINGKKINLNT